MLKEILESNEVRANLLKNKITLNGDKINDLIYYTYSNLGYPRENLPQIDVKDFDSLLLHFKDFCNVKKIEYPLYKLKPAQKELNPEKILNKLKTNSKQWIDRIYICSKNYTLVDGHHDFAHGLEINPNQMVNIYKIDLPYNNLIKRIKQMKISKRKDLLDNLLENYGIKA